jgi:hypothetical protein
LLIAETSCESRNLYLDRALLVSTMSATDGAFFWRPRHGLRLAENRVGSVGSFQGKGKELSHEGNGTRRLKPRFSAVNARAMDQPHSEIATHAVGIDALGRKREAPEKTIADGKGHSGLRSYW